jgi:hypothetical protein
MADVWYYVEGDKPIGPLTLSDMRDLLSRVADARKVLVWRDGLSNWVSAESVPELISGIIKPPPLPASAHRGSFAAPTTEEAPRATSAGIKKREDDLVGIGGWLILLAIGQVLGPLKYLGSVVQYYIGLDSNLWTKFPIAFYGEAVLQISLLALMCYTAYLFFTKSKAFPTFFIFEYVAGILIYPVDVIFSAATLSAYTGVPVETYTAKMMDSGEVGRTIAMMITAAVWIPYIKLSKRVSKTFVR